MNNILYLTVNFVGEKSNHLSLSTSALNADRSTGTATACLFRIINGIVWSVQIKMMKNNENYLTIKIFYK